MAQLVQRLLEHLPLLLRTGRRLTRSDAEAEDLAHDTVVHALDRAGTLREPERLRGWLLAVQRTVFLNGRRGLRARLEVLDGGLAATEPAGNLADDVHRNGIDDELARALATLPAEWREALVLREVEDLSYAEIAEVQGCPIGTVRSRLARARDAMERALTDTEVGRARMQR